MLVEVIFKICHCKPNTDYIYVIIFMTKFRFLVDWF